ncbi:MAG: AraC family transcriptional regulator [Chelatococcus sp.]|nr:MAG: AraC family transcriptional regulator [Chelatococcus sp.]
MIAAGSPVAAQSRIAPPGAVESAPLAPPPGTEAPAPAQVQAPAPPAAVPEPQPGPQPVQPAPPAPSPVVPQPVQPAPTPSVPLEPQPVQPPPAPPQPGQALPPVAPPQQTLAPDPNATLAGRSGDPSDVDEITLIPKSVLTLSGQASWDQGFERLSQSFRVLREQASRSGLPVAGRPLTLFTETDDNGFRFEAMLPIAPSTGAALQLPEGMRIGTSPAGRALRFTHVAPYDDIDSTYETITAYLEAKSITVKDAFLEEYVGDLKDPGDPSLEINVYVQPK